MFFGTITMLILYLILKYILSWITYFNNLDPRLGNSTWRWSYDYHVIGERDISDLDDKDFIRLRRKKNKIIGSLKNLYKKLYLGIFFHTKRKASAPSITLLPSLT